MAWNTKPTRRTTGFAAAGLVALIGLVGCGGSDDTPTPDRRPTPPTAKEALGLILRNGDMSLAKAKSCVNPKVATDDQTILDYLATALSYQADPVTKNSLRFEVKRIGDKDDGNVEWQSDIVFHGEDSEDVWNYGVRITIRNNDRSLKSNSMTCIP